MIKKVITMASETMICVGGDCCVPIAILRNEKTMMIRVKLVITRTSEGAKTSSVSTIMIFIVVMRSLGSFGTPSVRFTVGMVGSAPNAMSATEVRRNTSLVKI